MGCIVSSTGTWGDLKKKNSRIEKSRNQNFKSAPNSANQA